VARDGYRGVPGPAGSARPYAVEVGDLELRAQLLGRMRVTVRDRTVTDWPRPSARRLVALLLLAPGHVLSREQVAERLFPHLEPAKAGRAVSRSLSMARSALTDGERGVNLLAADLASIWIADHVDVEVDLLDHLRSLESALAEPDPTRRATRLRQVVTDARPVLADDAYEDWAIEIAEQIERRRREVRLLLARTSGTASDWQLVADADPANEEAGAALIAAHLEAGRPQDAVRAAAACHAALTELGLPPQRDLFELVPADDPERVSSAAGLWPLFGRDVELAAVLGELRPTTDRGGGAVLVAGPAGTGKTHLLRHALARLTDEGWRAASGTSLPDDHLVPFASLRTALATLPIRDPEPLVGTLIRPAAALAPDGPMQPTEVAALADALRRQLDAIAVARPLVLCLDDVQWADRALQRVITRLATGVGERRWSLLLAARTDEPGAPLPDLPTSVLRLSLPTLDVETSVRLARHALEVAGAPAAAAEGIAARGRGNAFFIVELARTAETSTDGPAGSRPVPERIADLLQHRLAVCSPAARRLAALIAVAGDDAKLAVLQRAAAPLRDEDAPLGGLIEELERAWLVRAAPDGLRLVHPLLRDAAVLALGPVRRAALHRRLAEATTSATGKSAGTTVLVGARHRLAAFELTRLPDDAAKAAAAAFEAAPIARQLAAPEVAMELYRRGLGAFAVLDEGRRARRRTDALDAWLGLGTVRLDLADYTGATEAFERALGLVTTVDERAVTWRLCSEVDYRQGDLLTTISRLERWLDEIPEEEGLARARLLVHLGWCHSRRGQHDVAIPILEEAVARSEDTGEWLVLAQAYDRVAFAMASAGSPERSLPTFETARDAAVRCGDPHELAVTHLHHGAALSWCGRPTDALRQLGEAAALCERYGFVYAASLVRWATAWAHDAAGDLEAALADRDAELGLLAHLHNDRHLAGCQAHRARLLSRLERHAAAAEAAQAAIAAAARVGDDSLTEEVTQTLA
jgi:DNA-binding SARP family transcriptional activator/tetratricopeptide (TPR) repeat protein